MSTINKNGDDTINEALLEKLKSSLPKVQENGETIRSSLAKLHLRVTSPGKTKLIYINFDWNLVNILIIH